MLKKFPYKTSKETLFERFVAYAGSAFLNSGSRIHDVVNLVFTFRKTCPKTFVQRLQRQRRRTARPGSGNIYVSDAKKTLRLPTRRSSRQVKTRAEGFKYSK